MALPALLSRRLIKTQQSCLLPSHPDSDWLPFAGESVCKCYNQMRPYHWSVITSRRRAQRQRAGLSDSSLVNDFRRHRQAIRKDGHGGVGGGMVTGLPQPH